MADAAIHAGRLTSRLAGDLSTYSELSYADYLVLVGLTDGSGGRLRLFRLAATLGWEKSRVSHQRRLKGR